MNEQLPHTDMVNDWIVGYLTNSLTPEEMQSLQNWLNVSEENREYFSDMQEVWIAASDEADEQHFDKERAYQLFLEHTESLVRPSLKRKAFTISPWIYVAAMVVIVFFCGTIAFQSGKRVLQNQLTQITVEAPYGSKTKLYLPDGTLVWLNAGSKMSYAQDFGINERSLNLSGEAYFEVSKDPKHPFIVQTETIDVQVLGTHFNVDAYHDNLDVKTTLLSGSVAVSNKSKSVRMVLKPNEIAIYNKVEEKLTRKVLKNAEDEISWRQGEFIFDDLPLQEIARELSNSFGATIHIADTALQNYRITARFRDGEDLATILSVLHNAGYFNYSQNNKQIIITAKPD